MADTLHERDILRFEPIEVAAVACPRKTQLRRNVEDQRQVRLEVAQHELLQGHQRCGRQAAPGALIRPAGVDESITDHVAALVQRRSDRCMQVRRASGEDQQQFGRRIDPLRPVGEDQAANRLG